LPGGLVTTITDALGRVTKFNYQTDSQSPDFGRLISVVYAFGTPLAATYSFEYSAAGNVSAQVDPLGNSGGIPGTG
jgi:YD repeat-containing protein